MQIPKDKKERVKAVFGKLGDKGLSKTLHEVIGGWFLSEDSKDEKERALSEYFDDTFDFTRNPSKQAYRSYNVFIRKVKSKKTAPVRLPLHKRMAFKVAAVLIPALVLTGSVFLLIERAKDTAEHGLATMVSVSAPAGDERTVLLPDNTKILMAEGCEIRHAAEFGGNRSVELKGEALFNVAKATDEDDCFSVHTDHFKIVVLGTEFRVHSLPDEDYSTIDLYHGNIEVEAGGRKLTMKPTEHLYYDRTTNEITITRLAPGQLVYDRMPGLVFDDTPITEVFDLIEKDYGVRFAFDGDAASTGTAIKGDLSGVKSLDELMRALQKISGQFTYEITESEIIVKIDSI